MDAGAWLGVTDRDALQFFLEHLRDVTESAGPPSGELVYNASVLAHFATTSTASQETFPACPASLTTVFDLFVLDRSRPLSADIMEAAAAQCLLLTGFFQDQQRRRHQLSWYAALGMAFFARAAAAGRDPARARLLGGMAKHFEFWRIQQYRLARELREEAGQLLTPRRPA